MTQYPRDIHGHAEMDRKTFVEAYGGIFEHSAWIAEGVFDHGLGSEHETADDLHKALCQVFRSATNVQKLAVLKAHPDLAGKLAQAKRLTAESTSEQAAAGLDALTDTEKSVLTDLNQAYVTKHGFPFIIAVRDHDKIAIIAAFKRRLSNDTDVEFQEACTQVERIAEFRLMDILP